MVVTAVSNVEQARMRELAGMRRQSNEPSSRREGGFRAGQRRSPQSQNMRGADQGRISGYAPNNTNQNGANRIEQSRDEREVDYQRGLGSARRGANRQNENVSRGVSGEQIYRDVHQGMSRMREDNVESMRPDKKEIRRVSTREIEHGKGLARVRKALEHVDPETAKKFEEIEQKYESGIKTAKEAKTLILSANPVGVWGLIKEISLLVDWMYIAAILAALFKDILIDGSQIGTVPAVGTVITALVSIFMASMYLLSNFIKHDRSIFQKQMITWLAGFLVDAIPILNLVPALTFSAALVYLFSLASRRNKRKEQEKIQKALKTEK